MSGGIPTDPGGGAMLIRVDGQRVVLRVALSDVTGDHDAIPLGSVEPGGVYLRLGGDDLPVRVVEDAAPEIQFIPTEGEEALRLAFESARMWTTLVATGPAPDMFELGAHVQVLSKGSMYAQRARRLYDIYKAHEGVDSLPAKVRARLETKIFRRSIDDIWTGTRAYWAERDPSEVARAERDPKHHMALIFRWYLGMTSRWARTGEADRVRDYQVWCGPSMGLFNAWSRGTPLAELSSRKVVDVAQALLEGAAACRRAEVARALGVRV